MATSLGNWIARTLGAKATGTLGRFIGGTGIGSPSTGTWAVGDFCVDARGFAYVCTSAGTPGSWIGIGKNGFFYIREFGAKTDGSTDDTAAFTAAMAAVQAFATPGFKFQNGSGTFQAGTQANGAGTVLLDPGVSVVSNIVLAHRAAIQGHGKGSGIFQKASSTGPVIKNRRDGSVHAKYTTLKDFRIHGNSANQSSTTNHGIYFQGTEAGTYNDTLDEDFDECHRVENVDIIFTKGDGLKIEDSGRNNISNVTVRNSTGNGIWTDYDNNFTNCDVGWSGNHGFYVNGDDCRFATCKSWYSTMHGYYIASDSGVMDACSAQDNDRHGLVLDGAYGWKIDCMLDSNSKTSAGTYPQLSVFSSSNNTVNATIRNRFGGTPTGTLAAEVAGNGTGKQNKITVNPGIEDWGVTTLLSAASTASLVSGNEVSFGANATGYQEVAYATTVTPNPLNGGNLRIANVTGNLTIANPSWKWQGARLRIKFKMNATGGYTLALGSDFESGITLDNTADAINDLDCIYSATSGKWERW